MAFLPEVFEIIIGYMYNIFYQIKNVHGFQYCYWRLEISYYPFFQTPEEPL